MKLTCVKRVGRARWRSATATGFRWGEWQQKKAKTYLISTPEEWAKLARKIWWYFLLDKGK